MEFVKVQEIYLFISNFYLF